MLALPAPKATVVNVNHTGKTLCKHDAKRECMWKPP